ncbi:hypothetical protein [Agrobacterium sp. 22-223-1]
MAKASKDALDNKVKEQDERRDNYNRVVAAAELGAIQLVKLDFDVSPDYYIEQADAELGYVVKAESSEYDEESRLAACIISFQVNALRGDEPLLQCNATYTVMYEIADDCDIDAVKTFVERVGVFACYPYFRGVFASLDWAANTRLPPLPVHKEETKKKAKSKARKKAVKALPEH